MPGREPGQGEGCGVAEGDTRGERDAVGHRGDHQFGVASGDLEADGPRDQADVILTPGAILAVTACEPRRDGDRHPDLEAPDVRTEGDDFAGHLGPHDMGKGDLGRDAPLSGEKIEVINAAGPDAEQHLVGPRDRIRVLLVAELFDSTVLVEDYRVHWFPRSGWLPYTKGDLRASRRDLTERSCQAGLRRIGSIVMKIEGDSSTTQGDRLDALARRPAAFIR